MKKLKLLLVLVVVGSLLGFVLPESESIKAEPKVVVELTAEQKAQIELKAYRNNRYTECYGAMTIAHKKNGFQERNRSQAIKIREKVCTLAVTDATITGWNTVYTEIK